MRRLQYDTDPAAAEPVREMPETTANWAGPHAPTHPNRPVYTVDRPPAAPPDEGDDFPFDAVFCIFTPAHRVDQVVLQIQVPSDVEAALADVQDDRDPTCRERYPLLLPVDPQPCEAYASLIALPTWADEMPVVLCDCRQAGGAMFAVVISPVMRREDLLVVAGLGRGAGVHVYVSYYAWALAPGQAVQLTTGQYFAVVPHGSQHVHGPTLSDMLSSPDGWDLDAPVPEIHAPNFWVLTDVDAVAFPVPERPAANLRTALAAFLAWRLQDLTVRATVPRIADHSDLGGRHCAVLVATRIIQRPTQRPSVQPVAGLDLRPLLRGLEWFIPRPNRIPLQSLLDRFLIGCPHGFLVTIKGGRLDAAQGPPEIVVQDGQVLVVEYVEDLLGAPTDIDGDDAAPPSPSSTASGPSARSRSPPGFRTPAVNFVQPALDQPGLGSVPGQDYTSLATVCPSHKSRCVDSMLAAPVTALVSAPCRHPSGRVVMWRSDFLDDADTPSHPSPTPFLPVGDVRRLLGLFLARPSCSFVSGSLASGRVGTEPSAATARSLRGLCPTGITGLTLCLLACVPVVTMLQLPNLAAVSRSAHRDRVGRPPRALPASGESSDFPDSLASPTHLRLCPHVRGVRRLPSLHGPALEYEPPLLLALSYVRATTSRVAMCTQIPQPALPYGFLLCASALLVVLCLPVGSMDPNRHGPDCSSSQSCARRPRRGASPFFWALLGAHLSCPLMAARLPAESGQSPCPATAPACIVPVTLPRRPVPTPCRPSNAGGVAGLRAPVSPAHRFALQDGCRWDGPTLLEQAVRQPGCPAYFLACTLLQTL